MRGGVRKTSGGGGEFFGGVGEQTRTQDSVLSTQTSASELGISVDRGNVYSSHLLGGDSGKMAGFSWYCAKTIHHRGHGGSNSPPCRKRREKSGEPSDDSIGRSGPTHSEDAGRGAGALDALLGWKFYVVKFRNNPQHLRVLANEMLATRLAARVELPVPVTAVVEVGEWLVEHTPELSIQLAHNTIRCQAGLQFGSQYVVSPLEGQVLDYLPVEMLDRVRNLETFPGMLVLDKWTGNANGRQAAFWKKSARENLYRIVYRSGILLQRGGMDVSRLSAARGVCAERSV